MIKGVIPAIITPVTESGELNVTALEGLIEKLISEGADGFYACGATGEGLILTKDVHKAMVRETVRITNGRVPTIVHVARTDFLEMLELARYAEQVGAYAISAIPPIFYKYGEEEIYKYYERLCAEVNIPVVIYNNPNTGVTFSQGLLKRLFSIENLTAIKWTNYDFAMVLRVKRELPDFNFINGPDEMLLFGLMAGCDAGIGTTYNFLMPEIRAIYDNFRAGNYEQARLIQSYVDTVIGVLLGGGNIIVMTKFILSRMGLDTYHALAPTAKLTAEAEEKLLADLRAVGFNID